MIKKAKKEFVSGHDILEEAKTNPGIAEIMEVYEKSSIYIRVIDQYNLLTNSQFISTCSNNTSSTS